MDPIARHQAAGRTFTAGGVQSFVLDAGDGEPVVCMHGVPVSSYAYRRLVPALEDHGLRGDAFDLPGLGLADRPQDFDYSWTGLGRWALAAIDALDLEEFHLVVHDIGGPVGFEVAAAVPSRVRSLTVLNTLVAVDGFTKPLPMRPFGVRGLGEIWLRSMKKPTFRALMKQMGIAGEFEAAEIDAHLDLLRRGDGGRAFLAIMRGFETTAAKQALYEAVLGSDAYPVQVVWGEQDPALGVDVQGEAARRAARLDEITLLPGKHLVMEDLYDAIAARVVRIALS